MAHGFVQAPPAPRSSPVGFIIGMIGALIALLAVIGPGSFLVMGRDTVNVTFEQPSGGTKSGPKAPADPNRFDLPSHLESARQAARKHLPDAELATLTVVGLLPSGEFELKSPQQSVAYIFRSPAASKTGKRCLVSVSASMYGTFAAPIDDASYDCKQSVTSAPRCSLKAVLAKAPAGAKNVTFRSEASA